MTEQGVMAARASTHTGTLRPYRSKRRFSVTPEPRGRVKRRTAREPLFVIQKHAASRLHYDFRLEINGVLVSWALPKGPPTSPRMRRLAIRTEDHPLEYATFEGTIPLGNYGAGTVMVWDIGTFKAITHTSKRATSAARALDAGKIDIVLNGHKLQGEYVLIRTNYEPREQWLLIKKQDGHASKGYNPVATHNRSVLTDRTMREIAAHCKPRRHL